MSFFRANPRTTIAWSSGLYRTFKLNKIHVIHVFYCRWCHARFVSRTVNKTIIMTKAGPWVVFKAASSSGHGVFNNTPSRSAIEVMLLLRLSSQARFLVFFTWNFLSTGMFLSVREFSYSVELWKQKDTGINLFSRWRLAINTLEIKMLWTEKKPVVKIDFWAFLYNSALNKTS